MRHRWSEDEIEFKPLVLDVEDRNCRICSAFMHVCDHRKRHIFTLGGGVLLVNRLQHCVDKKCKGSRVTVSPEGEMAIAMPGWAIGWDVFAWIGHRRFSRHWSVSQIRQELWDSRKIRLSDDAIEEYILRYQAMVAARQQDPAQLAREYRGLSTVLLSIDGLQPEKGHETLYVVRELNRLRVWFAQALISSSGDEVRNLVVRAKQMAKDLGLSVAGWVSDKQEAFCTAIAAEFPGVPHRLCRNHFLRDLAKPMMEKDSHAKVAMRRKVRGLRSIERGVLAERTAKHVRAKAKGGRARKSPPAAEAAPEPAADSAGQVALDYCAAVRGILNSDQGGPLSPPGLRMAGALEEVNQSLERSAGPKKGGPQRNRSSSSPRASTGDSRRSKLSKRNSAKR